MNIVFPEEFIQQFSEIGEAEVEAANQDRESTNDIVSKVGYLIGVPRQFFEKSSDGLSQEIYRELDGSRSARIIRNLCMLRTALIRNNGRIYRQMQSNMKNLHTLPDLVPQESLMQLEQDGISIVKSRVTLNQYNMEINRLISDRINNCQTIFPVWIKWAYIRELFVMPKGTTEAGVKAGAAEYYEHKSSYPFGVYLNWPGSNNGNILYNDRKFVSLLYEVHEDYFGDYQKVTNAGDRTRDDIYSFLELYDRTAIVVDCENSDPYKLYAMLNNLDQEALLNRICKIMLYNDAHTATAWKILEQFTDIPIEHYMVERILENKSLVDVSLTAGTCREHYVNGTQAFILASSDSDFWALISSLPEADFLVMIEAEKCSPATKETLRNAGFHFCYLDNFCTGNSDAIQIQTLLSEVRNSLEQLCHFNIEEVLANAYYAARVTMSTSEKNQFYDRYIRGMRLVISPDGDVSLKIENRPAARVA